MPNGECIQFGTNVNFILESDHLRSASPATISHLNMICPSEEDVDTRPLVYSCVVYYVSIGSVVILIKYFCNTLETIRLGKS
eukprot:14734538-Heterocapsa_arctica.AAC.1